MKRFKSRSSLANIRSKTYKSRNQGLHWLQRFFIVSMIVLLLLSTNIKFFKSLAFLNQDIYASTYWNLEISSPYLRSNFLSLFILEKCQTFEKVKKTEIWPTRYQIPSVHNYPDLVNHISPPFCLNIWKQNLTLPL